MEGLLLGGITNFCASTAPILSLVGWALTIFKIAIPLIIVVIGLIDLGKAAVSSKPEEIKKSVGSLLWRLIGGIAIFFIPTIIMAIFGLINNYNTTAGKIDSEVCYTCIISPWKCPTQDVE